MTRLKAERLEYLRNLRAQIALERKAWDIAKGAARLFRRAEAEASSRLHISAEQLLYLAEKAQAEAIAARAALGSYPQSLRHAA